VTRFLPRLLGMVVIAFIVLGALLPARGLVVVLRSDGPPLRPLSVTVEDRTGLVLSVAEATIDAAAGGDARDSFAAVAGRPDAIVYRWLGGACDRAATIHVDRSDGHVVVRREDVVTGDSCLMIGITRAVVIGFREPVDPATVVDLTNLLA
jgi:hypothetical protein